MAVHSQFRRLWVTNRRNRNAASFRIVLMFRMVPAGRRSAFISGRAQTFESELRVRQSQVGAPELNVG